MSCKGSMIFVALALEALAPGSAWAAARINVSAARGSDANPACGSVASPCRSLQFAHDHVTADGEIDILDPGGYGALTITKGVTILNDGAGVAGILATAGDAITINTGQNGKVVLKGLTVTGGGTATNGLKVITAKKLVIANSSFLNFSGRGILIEPNGADIDFSIIDTLVAGAGDAGIAVANTFGFVIQGSLIRTTSSHNSNGIRVDAVVATNKTNVAIDDSHFDHGAGYGVNILNGAAASARGSTATHNFVGFATGTGGTLTINGCVALDNGTDVAKFATGGPLKSTGNNQFVTSFNVTSAPLQ